MAKKKKIINPCPKCGAETKAMSHVSSVPDVATYYERSCPSCHWHIESPTRFGLIDAYDEAMAHARAKE